MWVPPAGGVLREQPNEPIPHAAVDEQSVDPHNAWAAAEVPVAQ
jgi:hypothetical protein